jgi:hypothetical protein
LAERRGGLRIRPIEYPAGVLHIAPCPDQPSAAQNCKVVGYKALGEVQYVLDLADAELRFGEKRIDAEAGLVRKGLEEINQVLS